MNAESVWARLIPAFALAAALRGQAIDSYQNPPGLRWKQIDTPHFEIVFPEELTDEGLRVAAGMERLSGPLRATLDGTRGRFPLFLTNQGAQANGFVTLAPRKSVWFHQPAQGTFTGSGDWYGLLAAHEGRHMVQFDAVNTGFTRFAGWLAGETGTLALSMFSIPLWWWEGDAVCMETALTRNGRGRIPEFGMGIRVQLMSGIRYSYSKAYLGSYRDWTPDWYELGYPLVAHVRKQHGPSAWNRVIRRTSKWSFWPFSFSHALKKETGKGPSALYSETLSELSELWRMQAEAPSFPEYRILNPESSAWTDYRFPLFLDDSTVVAQKWGLDDPWTLVAMDRSGNEKVLKRISPLEPGGTKGSAAAGKIVWDEAVPDIRWGAKSLPAIVVYDAHTGKSRRMHGENRFFNPSLSPDGGRIAAVEFGTDRACGLVILDAGTGRLIRGIPSPDNGLIQAPSWSEDGRRVVFTLQGKGGKGISICDSGSGEIREVLPRAQIGISHPVLFDRWILFSSPKSGIGNIHALELGSGTEFQVTSLPGGAYSPQVSPDGKRLLFSTYTAKGMAVCETDFDPSGWKQPDSPAQDAAGYAGMLTAQENGPAPDEPEIPETAYPVSDYKPSSHLLNVHSWLPVSATHETGLFFLSNNGLNTLSLAAGPVFDTNENRVRLEAAGAYAGWFPVIDFGMSRGGRAVDVPDEKGGRRTDSWTETSALLGLSVPLNLSHGVYSTLLRTGVAASFTAASNPSAGLVSGLFNRDLVHFRYRIEFSRFRDGSVRDVAPAWGQTVSAQYRHTALHEYNSGSQFFSHAVLYMPGFVKHHSWMLRAAWEEQRPDSYLFSTVIPFSRGYDPVFHNRLVYGSVSYGFPLFYPDLGLGPLAYLKRVSGQLFFDYTGGTDGDSMVLYRSAGIELRFETYFFNLKLPFDLGVRWVYRAEDGGERVEGFVSLDGI